MNPVKWIVDTFRDEDGAVRVAMRTARRGIRQATRENYAIWWRKTLKGTTVIGITGSGGKSTTTSLVGKILAETAPTHLGVLNNTLAPIAWSVLKARKSHKFLVQEVSGNAKGIVSKAAKLIRPDVAIITTIGTDHLQNFRSMEAIAEEKGKLVEALPADGLAVLNADDPLVMSMAGRTKGRVVTYGRAQNADFRLLEHEERFPQCLRLTVTDGSETRTIQTKMVGGRWVTPILAAIAACRTLDVEWHVCQKIVEAHEPIYQRDSVHAIADGPVFLLDCDKAPIWTFESSFETMANAVAVRKTMVIGTISDYPGSSTPKYKRIGREALARSDRVLFVGGQSARADKLLPEFPGRLWTFETAAEASTFLRTDSIPGELIYIKCSGTADHLERLFLNWEEPISCWRERCGRRNACRRCEELRLPPGVLSPERIKREKAARRARPKSVAGVSSVGNDG